MKINAGFDSGNIVVLSVSGDNAQLEIRKDAHCEYFQWFYFRVSGVKGRSITLSITNAGLSSFSKGWSGYKARFSYDRIHWQQQGNTRFENGVLTIEHTCECDMLWFAYFTPYVMEQHHHLIARMAAKPGVVHLELGQSVEGRSIDYLQLGSNDPSAKQVWLFGRQHPGESMAQWWVEGALNFLTKPEDEADARTVETLLQLCRFHVVPNMNPDGSFRGHIRTNALGVDLNRQWAAPNIEKSPEVFYVWEQMKRTGVDFAMDVHGDETIAANFLAGFKGIPNWREDKWALYTEFRTTLTAHHHDFQDQVGYGDAAPGKANLALATNQIANHFGCVAMTLEMPFKDHDNHAVPAFGWNAQRSMALARACLRVLAGMATRL